MESNINRILKGIKPTLEVNTNLKIKELEKENTFLQIQNKKLRKEKLELSNSMSKLTKTDKHKVIPKNTQIQYQEALVARNVKIKELNADIKRRAAANIRTNKEHQFLKKRITDKYGRQAYINLINHVDNPRPESIITGDRKDDFLTPDKGIKEKLKRYKTLQHENNVQLKFLENRIKEKLGREVFLELVNCPENPDQGKIIHDTEKFLGAGK